MALVLRFLALFALIALAIGWSAIFAHVVDRNITRLAEYGGTVRTTFTDFAAFWSAAQFAIDGRPLEALDAELVRDFQSMEEIFEGAALPWLYPPALLLLVTPLGYLDFITAWVVFVILSMLLLGAAIWRFERHPSLFTVLVVFSPVTMLCALRGQLAMLLAAAVLAGLAAWLRGRRIEAGLLLAVLSLKPQLCASLPSTAIASRDWRLAAAGVAGVVLYAALPTLVYGTDYWRIWFDVITSHQELVDQVRTREVGLITWRILASIMGASEAMALVFQGIMSLLTLVLLAAIWWSRRTPGVVKAASLLLGVVSITHYAWGYEAIFPLLGALLLFRAGYGPLWLRSVYFGALWLAPVAWLAGSGIPLSVIVMPLVLAGLLASAVIAHRAARGSGGSKEPAP